MSTRNTILYRKLFNNSQRLSFSASINDQRVALTNISSLQMPYLILTHTKFPGPAVICVSKPLIFIAVKIKSHRSTEKASLLLITNEIDYHFRVLFERAYPYRASS